MKDIVLLNLDREMLFLIEKDLSLFCSQYDAVAGNNTGLIQQVATQTKVLMQAVGGDHRWFGYLAIDKSTRLVIGICSFKGPPDDEKSVEIAYFTFPEFETRGYATSMARELIRLSLDTGEVDHVIAQTLPEPNASTKILQKLGMRFFGEVTDPDEGRLWKWIYDNPDTASK